MRTDGHLGRFSAAAGFLLLFFCSSLISCSSNPAIDPAPTPMAGKREAPSGVKTSINRQPQHRAASDTPIILVHGFGGWGRDDIPNFFYWGGFTDLQETLRGAGYTVYTASIGPFSSNRDRACELYAFIKGGTVDYGEHHSAAFDHERYGPTYPGVYPEWSEENPVHLIGHSMGGQTARLLAHLLRYGDPEERKTTGGECHELFQPGGRRIQSITTISTPHNGTTLVNDIDLIDTIIQAAIISVATAVESNLFPSFDLKMTQWGITREPDEPLARYFTRLRNHRVWSEIERDFSLWDTSVEGAAFLNSSMDADPEIYYFSYANEETATGPVKGYKIPEIGMLPPLMPGGVFLGSYTSTGPYPIDETWWQNDGVVNTVSMRGPLLGSRDKIVDFDGSPEPGEWNYMGLLESMDHGDVIGIPSAHLVSPEGYDSLVEFYLHICEMITALPR